MDLVIKDYFDKYRGDVPPELAGLVKGSLVADLALMNRWRNWRTGMEYHDTKRQAMLFGALDDCLEDKGLYTPLDYKTRGSAPEPGSSERYYQIQLDSYALLLEANGYPTSGLGYLVYYYPKTVSENGRVDFTVKVVEMTAIADRARKIFEAAVDLLKMTAPEKHSACEYCGFGGNLLDLDFD
jgi:hypothetical protein